MTKETHKDTITSTRTLQVKHENLHTSCSALTDAKTRSQPSPDGSPSPAREKHPDLWKATFSSSKKSADKQSAIWVSWETLDETRALWACHGSVQLCCAGREHVQMRYQLHKKFKGKEKKILAMIPWCCCPSLKVSSKASGYLSHSSETEN